VKRAPALLSEARFVHSRRFHPEYVIADAGYSSDELRHLIRRQYHSQPVIDPNPSHKRATLKTNKTDEWRAVYKTRTAIERLNGRLKGFYKLNDLRVRGHMKVAVHALMAVSSCRPMLSLARRGCVVVLRTSPSARVRIPTASLRRWLHP
jgi:hypothetical protein